MAQASSAYSTSGTQYNATNSYYLLDTVAGSGDAIPGPVTITAAPPAIALTVAGTTIMTGELGVAGVLTAAGDLHTNNINPIVAGPTGQLDIVSGGGLVIAGGVTDISSQSGNLTLAAPQVGASAKLVGDQARVTNSAGAGMYVNQGELLYGFNANFNQKVQLEHGLSLRPGMGTYAAPAAATAAGGGAFTFTMTGNKAFITTTTAAFNLFVLLPLDGLGNTCDWTALITQVGATATNVTTVTQSGISLIFLNAALTTPITVAITLF